MKHLLLSLLSVLVLCWPFLFFLGVLLVVETWDGRARFVIRDRRVRRLRRGDV